MSYIHFTDEQYENLRVTYRKWWKGELNRPIVPFVTHGYETKMAPTKAPLLGFTTAWDFSIDPRQFIEAHTYALSSQRFHGEAYPIFFTQRFGAGAMAAFLGCKPKSAPNTIWFLPEKQTPIEELHFEYDENNVYWRRVLNTIEAAQEAWRGQVVIGMPDLGGILDVLASFRNAEDLLMDLIDDPDEVLRCVKELQELWFVYYNKINDILRPEAKGYSQWFNVYGEEPGYMLQSDFSYMISPDMFRQFVGWELSSTAYRMTNAIYHMDGIGEIPHLDQLLAIDGIKGIQWQPGEGTAMSMNWDDLLKRILASGKKLLSWNQKPDGSPIDFADPGQLYFGTRYYGPKQWEDARRYADMYGIRMDMADGQGKEDSPLLTAKYRWE